MSGEPSLMHRATSARYTPKQTQQHRIVSIVHVHLQRDGQFDERCVVRFVHIATRSEVAKPAQGSARRMRSAGKWRPRSLRHSRPALADEGSGVIEVRDRPALGRSLAEHCPNANPRGFGV
jgi:hypothetical protein